MLLEVIFSVQKGKQPVKIVLWSPWSQEQTFHKGPGNLYVLSTGPQPSPGVGLMAWVLAVETPSRGTGALCRLTLLLAEIMSNSLELPAPFSEFFLLCP